METEEVGAEDLVMFGCQMVWYRSIHLGLSGRRGGLEIVDETVKYKRLMLVEVARTESIYLRDKI